VVNWVFRWNFFYPYGGQDLAGGRYNWIAKKGALVKKKYFEDFEVGDSNRKGSHTVTREEIIAFAQEFDPQPFHIDEAAANASVFGGLTAAGSHTVALQIKLIHSDRAEVESAVLAGMGWDEVRFPNPVRPGDTLSLLMECIDTRVSKSKPDRGIVRNKITVLNQNEDVVLESIHTILVARRRN
jgi:acyl dehydratase